jgi:hypothetical protein
MNAIDAVQRRYPGGYSWFDAGEIFRPENDRAPVAANTGEPDFVLSTGLSAGSYEFESYSPQPNLFLLFADTRDTRDAIKGFADQFGLLGLNQADGAVMLAMRPSYRNPRKGAICMGELFSAWRREAREMRQAVGLWSALREAQSGDKAKLSLHIGWRRDDFVYYDSHLDLPLPREARLLGIPGRYQGRFAGSRAEDLRTLAVIASKEHNPEWLRFFHAADCVRPAQYYLQKIVNERLKTHVSPQLLWNLKGGRPDKLGLFFVPQSLLGLMWLQLAEAINGNRTYRQCSACKTWMVISPESVGKRSSRLTCSDACRMKVYYGRMVKARHLARQGLSAPEIARKLGTTSDTVHGWMRKSKKPGNRGPRDNQGRLP